MIENGKKVTLQYTLTVDGNVVDQSTKETPLVYEHGSGQIIPGLEKEMQGMTVGDKKQVQVSPEDAYGTRNSDAIIDIPKTQIRVEDCKVGTTLQGTDDKGNQIRGTVTEIGEEKVKVDFNHPLAGKLLYFDVEVIEIN